MSVLKRYQIPDGTVLCALHERELPRGVESWTSSVGELPNCRKQDELYLHPPCMYPGDVWHWVREKDLGPACLRDAKEALSGNRKPDITHARGPLLVYVARACEYGAWKYQRANYLRAVDAGAEDFNRFRAYLRATLSHVVATLDEMELHQARDPDLHDQERMKRAAYAEDTDAPVNGMPSFLPHVAHAAASLQMAIVQAVHAGLLPADPGTPWKDQGIRDFSTSKDPK